MRRFNISHKIIISFILCGIISIAIVGVFSFYLANRELSDAAYGKLHTVASLKKMQITNQINDAITDAAILAESDDIIELTLELLNYKDSFRITDKGSFIVATDHWSKIYNNYAPKFEKFINLDKYTDILLINARGQIMFTANKSRDLGANLISGRLSETNLAVLWDYVQKNGKANISDFQKYAPNRNAVVTFTGAPIIVNNQVIGVVALEYPVSVVNQIMKQNDGMGNTSEAFLVGEDYLMRSDARLSEEKTTLTLKIRTQGIEKAFNGSSGTTNEIDYRGEETLMYYTPLEIEGLNWVIAAKIDRSEVLEPTRTFNTGLLIIFVSLLLLLLLFSYLLSRYISRPIKRIRDIILKLGSGVQPDEKLKFKSNDELADISQAINELVKGLKKTASFAEEIGQGKLSTDYTPLSNEDILGNSLLNMRKSLKKAQDEEEKRKVEDKIRNWATKGQAMFAELLRQTTKNVRELGENIIKNIVEYVEANQGGIFIYNDDDKNDVHLQLIGAYAFDRKKHLEKRIELGEGLVGTCAIEKAVIYIDDIPDDYIEITSGLGDAMPKYLLVIPLKNEQNILGVIELASFKPLKKYEIDFLEKLAESIASTLANAKINERTNQLLKKFKQQSEDLASKEEEMRQNLEEMQATREEATRKEIEMSGIIEAIDHSLIKAEFDTDGLLIDANRQFLEKFGYSIEQIRRKNVFSFIEEDELEQFKRTWEIVAEGNQRQITAKRKSKFGDEIWLLASFTPIIDDDGNVLKILYLANDITPQKRIEHQAKKQAEELAKKENSLRKNLNELQKIQEEKLKNIAVTKGIEQAIDENYLRADFSLEGNLIMANDKFKNQIDTKTAGENFNILNHIAFDQKEDFKKIWQNVCSGKSTHTTQKINISNTNHIWLSISLSAIRTTENKVEKILLLASNITEQKRFEQDNIKQAEELRLQEKILQQGLEEMERTQQEYAEKVEALEYEKQKTKEMYQEEMEKMYVQWKEHIDGAEKHFLEKTETHKTIEQKEKTHKKQIEDIQKKMKQKAAEPKEIKAKDPVEKKYQQWLKKFGKKDNKN